MMRIVVVGRPNGQGRRFCLSAALVGALIAVPSAVSAQKYYPAQPAPEKALAGFAEMAGSWTCRGTFPGGGLKPGSPPVDYKSTVVVTPIHEGHAYRISYAQHFPDDTFSFQGTSYVGFDRSTQKLLFDWHDNMGSLARETSRGWSDGRIVLTGFELSPPPDFGGVPGVEAAPIRDFLTMSGPDKFSWRGQIMVSNTDKWRVLIDDQCDRDRSAS